MSDNRTSEPSGVTNANGHSWMSWDESGKNGTYCRSCGGWVGKVGNRQCSPAPVLPSSGAPQAESIPKSTYISPNLPAQIRGLYRADLREKSIQTMLDLAGDLVQELIDLRAATVPPSSAVDEEKLAEVIEQAMRDEAMFFENGDEEWIAESDPVETIPAIARAVAKWFEKQ